LYLALSTLASAYVGRQAIPVIGIALRKAFLRHFTRHTSKTRLAFDDKRNVPIVNCSIAVKERPETWSE
ncbi:MAG: hypothetical protein KA252_03930, partial [Sphingorhabdus sp.]|jgi:hypothetical protein|nr:hypothetical protein [Sphingorhabdus sp.]